MNSLQTISEFNLVERDNILLVDSKQVAEALKIEHESYIRLIRTYQSDIESWFGVIRFEIGVAKNSILGSNPPKCCLLTEDQAIYIATLCRNTSPVVQFKAKLVLAFQSARRAAQSIQKELSRKDLALLVIKAEEELEAKNLLLAQQETLLIEQQPKVEKYDQFLDAENLISLDTAAKNLGIGRTRLTTALRDRKVFYKPTSNSDNHVYQKYIDGKYFQIKMHSITKGTVLTNYPQIYVTAKGMSLLQDIFKKESTPISSSS